MGKPTICLGENEGADQLRGNLWIWLQSYNNKQDFIMICKIMLGNATQVVLSQIGLLWLTAAVKYCKFRNFCVFYFLNFLFTSSFHPIFCNFSENFSCQ